MADKSRAAYQRQRRQEYPELMKLYALHSIANRLRKFGFSIIPPAEEELKAAITERINERRAAAAWRK